MTVTVTGTGSRRRPAAADGASAEAALDRSVKRFRAAQRRLAKRVSKQLEARTQPVSFRVASFNVLGDSHTGPGGNKPASYPDAGPAHGHGDLDAARQRHRRRRVPGVRVHPAQHVHRPRRRVLPLPGAVAGTKSVRFNIAWRSSMFSLVEAHTLSIPYAGGSRIEMPVVLLESTTTGRRAWFANFHNPADTPRLGNNATLAGRGGRHRDRPPDVAARRGRHPRHRHRRLQRARGDLLPLHRRRGVLLGLRWQHGCRLCARRRACRWTGSSAPPASRSTDTP